MRLLSQIIVIKVSIIVCSYSTFVRMHVGMAIKVSISMVQGYINDLEPLDNIEYNFINSHSISFNAKNY